MNDQPCSRSELNIVREEVLAEIPRGGGVLRVMYLEARRADGRDVAWHSLREFYRDREGRWKPGKRGITIRGSELRAVSEALTRTGSGEAAIRADGEGVGGQLRNLVSARSRDAG